MTDYSVHSVPEPFQDEDKWFKLTKRQILIIIPAALLVFFFVAMSIKWHILVIGIILATLVVILDVLILLYEVPQDKYLFGSGIRIEVLLFRLIKKELPYHRTFFPNNKVIYTKNLDNGYQQWGKKKR